jgi:hypothetical protein
MIDPFQIIRLFMGRAEGEGPWQQGFFCVLRPFWQPKYNNNKKFPSEYMGSWAVCKILSVMVPERPTPVKVHSSNFVYGEHIKRTQSDWKTQNNLEWNWNLTTNFQVHAQKKKIPFPSFTPCVPKGIFFFPSAQPLKLILTLGQSLQVIKVKYS